MGEIEDRIAELDKEIHTLKIKRDAQEPGDRLHELYQGRITQASIEQLGLEALAEPLAELDKQIARTERDLKRAAEDAYDLWLPPALFCACAGAVLLLGGLAFDAGARLLLLAGVLLVAAFALFVLSTRHRRRHDPIVDRWFDHLSVLNKERKTLLERRVPAPVVTGRVDVVSGDVVELPGGDR